MILRLDSQVATVELSTMLLGRHIVRTYIDDSGRARHARHRAS